MHVKVKMINGDTYNIPCKDREAGRSTQNKLVAGSFFALKQDDDSVIYIHRTGISSTQIMMEKKGAKKKKVSASKRQSKDISN